MMNVSTGGSAMPREISLLDQIQIASPCSASWDAMKGDDRVRFCESCKLHVYNLSAMTRHEAEALVERTEGRLCAGFHRRPDGTVLTRDCPVGLAAARRRLARTINTAAAAIVLVAGTAFAAVGMSSTANRLRNLEPFARLTKWLAPPAALTPIIAGGIGPVPGRVSFNRPINAQLPSIPGTPNAN
jgi:hypothetical protein